MYLSIVLLLGIMVLRTSLKMAPRISSMRTYMGFHNKKWRHMPPIPMNDMDQKSPPPQHPTNTKKLICISPGGFKGFYLSGVIAYIKDHYDVSEFYFSGASAGAWNALLFTYRGNLTDFMWRLIGSKPVVTQNETIRDYKYHLKRTVLENYTAADFDLARVFVGVTTASPIPRILPNKVTVIEGPLHKEEVHTAKMFVKTSIYSQFATLEDALDCCIASSHIPFFMGRVFHVYDNQVAFDGGFSDYPYYVEAQPVLNITSNMWNRSFAWPPGSLPKKRLTILEDYRSILSKDRYDFWELFRDGYEDSARNRAILDRILGEGLRP